MAACQSWGVVQHMSDSNRKEYDIVIAGGGITGLTLACLLRQTSLHVGIIDQQQPQAVTEEYALRVSAINRASLRVFHSVGAFELMQQQRVSPFREMHVWDSTGVGQVHFDSAELGLDTLGYIIENNVIQQALLVVAKQADNIDWICPATIKTIRTDDDQVHIQLEDGKEFAASLLVGADGMHSVVRDAMAVELVRKSYRQKAIVCTVTTQEPHQHTAWQCFSPSGPLAFLPLNDGSCSIVWSLDEAEADAMMALDDEAFAHQLEQAFEYRLGGVSIQSKRAAFPLVHGHVDQYVQANMALIGDAAHNIHPLAGQGANLGIMDAACLAETVVDALHAQRQWHALHTLSKYERRRKGDNRLMEAGMTSFKHLFGNANPYLTELRNVGLNLADHFAPLKKLFIRQALGGR